MKHLIFIVAAIVSLSCHANRTYIFEVSEIANQDNDSIIFDNSSKGHRDFSGYCEISESNIILYGCGASEILSIQVYNSIDQCIIGTFTSQSEFLSYLLFERNDITIIFFTQESTLMGRLDLSTYVRKTD